MTDRTQCRVSADQFWSDAGCYWVRRRYVCGYIARAQLPPTDEDPGQQLRALDLQHEAATGHRTTDGNPRPDALNVG